MHGLNGHRHRTFTYGKDSGKNKSSEHTSPNTTSRSFSVRPWKKARTARSCFWPRDLLPEHVTYARVITWGYDARVIKFLSSTSKNTIFHHSQNLISDLAGLRRSEEDKETPIIFIAHSLGGIIVKDALNRSKNSDQLYSKEILPATKGVIFLGVPHRGSAFASAAEIALLPAPLILQDPRTELLQVLQRNSETLDRIETEFQRMLVPGRLQVHSFQEELPTTKGRCVVNAVSSKIGSAPQTTGTLHANHRNMARLSSSKDDNFRRIMDVLNRWLDDNLDPVRNVATNSVPQYSTTEESLDDEYEKCLNSLDDAQARLRHESLKDAHTGTFGWIFDAQSTLASFLSGETRGNEFYIWGKPGSGKSTLMKFVLKHPETLKLLKRCHCSTWVVAAYFFHDRGTASQKTTLGFVREVVHQLLAQQSNLFPIIYAALRSSGDVTHFSSDSEWTLEKLDCALSAIVSQSEIDVNLCIFVDALDENDGDHEELIRFLLNLSQSGHSPSFRIRLCMAGRPGNAFRDHFRDRPGFFIQDKTTSDIEHYTRERIEKGTLVPMTDQGRLDLKNLLADVIDDAEGVFLWVKLACDELLDCLRNGSSLAELRTILATIPKELEKLYTRALTRTATKDPRVASELKHERYILFQIVRSAKQAISPYELLNMSFYFTSGTQAYPDIASHSQEQLEARLQIRSGGLLEIMKPTRRQSRRRPLGVLSGRRRRQGCIQFMHQTVKEYMMTGEGSSVLEANVEEAFRVEGAILLFKYVTGLLLHLSEQKIDLNLLERHMYKDSRSQDLDDDEDDSDFELLDFTFGSFYHFASEIENGKICTASDILQPNLSQLDDDNHRRIVLRLLRLIVDESNPVYVTCSKCQRSTSCLLIYLTFGYERSFEKVLQSLSSQHDGGFGDKKLVALLSLIMQIQHSSKKAPLRIPHCDPPVDLIKMLEITLNVGRRQGLLHEISVAKLDRDLGRLISGGFLQPAARRESLVKLWLEARGARAVGVALTDALKMARESEMDCD